VRQQAALRESVAFEHELALSVEAQRAVRVMMRKSPETQRTYTGIYDRFAGWLADREAVSEVPVSSFTSEAFVTYLERLEERCSPSTVKKERAALRKLARYLHQLGLIDAMVILMVEIPTVTELAPGTARPRPQQLGSGADRRACATCELCTRTLLAAGGCAGSGVDPDPRRRRAAIARSARATGRSVRHRPVG
jgi:hypothetical protein